MQKSGVELVNFMVDITQELSEWSCTSLFCYKYRSLQTIVRYGQICLDSIYRVVYPIKTKTGEYAELVLTSTCLLDRIYDPHTDSCRASPVS